MDTDSPFSPKTPASSPLSLHRPSSRVGLRGLADSRWSDGQPNHTRLRQNVRLGHVCPSLQAHGLTDPSLSVLDQPYRRDAVLEQLARCLGNGTGVLLRCGEK